MPGIGSGAGSDPLARPLLTSSSSAGSSLLAPPPGCVDSACVPGTLAPGHRLEQIRTEDTQRLPRPSYLQQLNDPLASEQE